MREFTPEEKICNTCLFKGKCPSENKKEVYEVCETIEKQAELQELTAYERGKHEKEQIEGK